MADSRLLKIWPTMIFRKRFHDHDSVKPNLLKFVHEYMEKYPEGRTDIVNRDLYESRYDIFKIFSDKDSGIKSIADFLSQSFIEVSTAANIDSWKRQGIDPAQLSVKFTASWFINYMTRGNVDPHLHGNCSWTCVYYLQMGPIKDPKDGATFLICPNNKSDSNDLGAIYTREACRFFQAEEGSALFFPANLVHGSFPYSGDEQRIIFSANGRIESRNPIA